MIVVVVDPVGADAGAMPVNVGALLEFPPPPVPPPLLPVDPEPPHAAASRRTKLHERSSPRRAIGGSKNSSNRKRLKYSTAQAASYLSNSAIGHAAKTLVSASPGIEQLAGNSHANVGRITAMGICAVFWCVHLFELRDKALR